MLMSSERTLVSHVGSLPRPEKLSDLLIRQEAGETIDAAELARQVETATVHVIDKQVEAGVDVGNDGEQSRVGFQTYVPRCLCGFGSESKRPPARDQLEPTPDADHTSSPQCKNPKLHCKRSSAALRFPA
jgi:5-methyltetrahydropteroyltriglutamate--homocysteine methyltransferase